MHIAVPDSGQRSGPQRQAAAYAAQQIGDSGRDAENQQVLAHSASRSWYVPWICRRTISRFQVGCHRLRSTRFGAVSRSVSTLIAPRRST